MGRYGWPLPLELGGGPSSDEKYYRALRSALGIGGYSVVEDGIDGLELQMEAMGLAAIEAFDERAALQAFQHLAQDNIPVFEDILRIVPPPGATDEDRRLAILELWTVLRSAVIPTFGEVLADIDERLSILDPEWSNSHVTLLGRAFEPYSVPYDGQAFNLGDGTKKFTDFPNYSTRSKFFVLFDLGDGVVPGLAELAIMSKVKRLLKLTLPSEVRPYIITAVGLIAGVSPVGYAGVSGS